MGKAKTHSGAAKRFKVTGTGKIKHKSMGMRHNLAQKTKKQKRRLNIDNVVGEEEKPRVAMMLGLKRSRRKFRYEGKKSGGAQ